LTPARPIVSAAYCFERQGIEPRVQPKRRNCNANRVLGGSIRCQIKRAARLSNLKDLPPLHVLQGADELESREIAIHAKSRLRLEGLGLRDGVAALPVDSDWAEARIITLRSAFGRLKGAHEPEVGFHTLADVADLVNSAFVEHDPRVAK